ncbi:N-acetylglucosaminyl-diphospho-decaprenol L-rhamnosyltransferase [Ferrithrix thermotolerans DSM 19514]|uniref:N-acetylglucosaminyl-diphospho-decaprenol L-rhamnosyltransferase n=1 Tax=Ferrithrix thermotolerans DSM 19514 TaxID=1121881 RepID=A0A1M4V635_9ACTN|nr:glycosyltransferase family 2 protein [Ferrithrix thermotolerans]SHE64380.1 N-acetylglucosaminyl-diphospho-decaprenol L-rhamnosyltransferase [Ferrithrix thermotolerans DSM 19514]
MSSVVVLYGQDEAAVTRLARQLWDLGVKDMVFVDNKSQDVLDHVVDKGEFSFRVVSSGKNLGYGRGVNLGVSYLDDSEFILVSNPDIYIKDGDISPLRAALEGDLDVGLVAPMLLNPDGSRYPSVRRYPDTLVSLIHGFLGIFWKNNPVSRWYKMESLDLDTACLAPWVSGAFFVMRTEVFKKIGGFDSKYFMYCEDVDLCERLQGNGLKVVYYPKVEVIHVQGDSSKERPIRSLYQHHRSMWLYAKSKRSSSLVLSVELFGIALRLLLVLSGRLVTSRLFPQGR